MDENKLTSVYFFHKVAIAIFVGILTLPTIVWGCLLLLNQYYPNIMNRLNYDLGENRYKAQFPATFNADTYTAELEAYYDDRVPFRSIIISSHNMANSRVESIYQQSIQPLLIDVFYAKENPDINSVLVNSAPISQLFEPNAYPGQEENITSTFQEQTVKDVLTHNYEITQTVVSACNENGFILYTCSECNDSYTETLPVGQHNYEEPLIVEPDYENFGYSLYVCNACGFENKQDFTPKLIDSNYFPPKILNNSTIVGRNDWLFYAGDDSVNHYRGTNLLDETTLADYAERVQKLQKICDEKGIQLRLMMIPNKDKIYSEYMPTYTIKDEYKRVPRLIDYIKEETGITILYPYDELMSGKLYWQTYYKYDSHWNSIGAFIATQLLYQSLEIPVTNLFNLQYNVSNRSGGDLVILGGLSAENYADDLEYDIVYKPEISVLDSHCSEISNEIYYATSSSKNTNNLVLIGDSYRLHMRQFLQKDFSCCTFSHRDYQESPEVIMAIQNADVLVLTCVERYDKEYMDSITSITNILSGKTQ